MGETRAMKLRCWLKLHRWSRWGTPFPVYLETYHYIPCRVLEVSHRWCQDCNLRDKRELGETRAYHPDSPYATSRR